MYHLFAGDDYYPAGGMHDYRGVFDSIEDTKARFAEGGWSWAHVVVVEDGDYANAPRLKIILEYGETEPYNEWREPQE